MVLQEHEMIHHRTLPKALCESQCEHRHVQQTANCGAHTESANHDVQEAEEPASVSSLGSSWTKALVGISLSVDGEGRLSPGIRRFVPYVRRAGAASRSSF